MEAANLSAVVASLASYSSAKRGTGMLQIAARQIRVLVVDDSSAFLSTLCSLLQDDPKIGLVAGARSGLEALAAVEQLHPDVVFMDLQLPELNGLEVTAKLRDLFPYLPVVMMTAHDIPGLKEICKRWGAHAFATKSRLLQELSAILADVVVATKKSN
jgi:CheY-like chemotaxis protein